jgi:S-adenosylmethionine hydrolase
VTLEGQSPECHSDRGGTDLVVTLLTDYGTADEFVGVVHAVIARIAPEARVIDLAHGIRRQDVVHGALVLAQTLDYAPPGVHVAVVDPGVGAGRRAVALRTAREDRLLVGPDNGLLMPAAARFGGVAEAVEISASPWRLEPVSATFHGRDLFAPVAAHLAVGRALADAGTPLDPAGLVALELPRAERAGDALVAVVAGIDAFGNVALHAAAEDLAAAGLRPGDEVRARCVAATPAPGAIWCAGLIARYGRTFAEVAPGDLLVHEDAAGLLAVARNQGDAAAVLGVGPGDRVEIAPA